MTTFPKFALGVCVALTLLSSVAQARFLQIDPVGYKDQMNLYGYVDNDPANKSDPTGTYGRGKGWTDPQWERFNQEQQATARDMERSANQLRKRADRLEEAGDKMGARLLRERAGKLSAGAANLRNDGSDGRTLAHLVSGAWMATMRVPGAAAFAPHNGTTISINKDSWSFNDRTDVGAFARQWTYGHESLHSSPVGLFDQVVNGYRAYRFSKPGSGERQAFDSITNTPRAEANPDHLMCEVYCGYLAD